MLSAPDPAAASAFYGRLFGWRAEPFDAGPAGQVWLVRLDGYLGGEPEQPVPRDVVAALAAASGGGPPPGWGVDFWTSNADAAAAAASQARRSGPRPGDGRGEVPGGPSSPIRTEPCSRQASSCWAPEAGLATTRVRYAPAQRRRSRGHQQHGRPGADHQAEHVREREGHQAGDRQQHGGPPAVPAPPDPDAGQAEAGQHHPAEPGGSRWPRPPQKPPIRPAAASGAVGSRSAVVGKVWAAGTAPMIP